MFNKCLVCNSIINSKIFKNRTFLCPLCKNLMIKDSFNHFMVRCKNCFYPLVDEIYECPRCNMDAEHLKIYSEYDYSASFTRRLFERYKFEYEIQLRFFWAFQYNRIIRHIIESNLIEIEKLIVIPVPCSKVNLKKRGWEHMLEICKVLKRKFHINYLNVLKTNTLAKKPALEQKKLNLKERILKDMRKYYY